MTEGGDIRCDILRRSVFLSKLIRLVRLFRRRDLGTVGSWCSLVRMREREMNVFDDDSVNKKKERIYIEMSK